MQKIIGIFLLLVSQFAVAQQQQMTLEDAVLGRYTYLRPETLNGLNWKNDHVFTWEENGAIRAEDAKNGDKSTLLTLKDANALLKPEADYQLQSFSGYSWTDDEALLVQHGGNYYALDVENRALAWKIQIPAEAENPVINGQGKFVAYTIGNDLYVSFSDDKQVRITRDGGNGIVNGKSVHRNEFGIRNGIFPSPEGNFIAFYRMDESMVTDYPVVDYMNRIAEHTPIK